jgi:beta-RFAP synthase
MFSFGNSTGPQFGGVGLMVEPPSVDVRIEPAPRFSICGALQHRTAQLVDLLAERWRWSELPACRIEVQSPADHTGLGVGTQLGLAIGAGMRRFLRLPELPAAVLAAAVGRGGRSAIGTHGFAQGGLLVDGGKAPGEELGRLERRIDVPSAWRFVLVRPSAAQGLAGEREAEAFSRLPPVPHRITHELWRITNERLLPAVEHADCRSFGEAVYDFGRLAGECFATVQDGPFASPEIARLVEAIREFGIAGVGQSSWGPTVYAVTGSEGEARELVNWLVQNQCEAQLEITIARANNRGAVAES